MKVSAVIVSAGVIIILLGATATYFYSQDQALQGQLASKSTSDLAIAGA
ncbi:MAG: hypothetical protein KGI26_06770 [Thaumarchaeota archaeon]|nr:hypothetical protein [Nitrososphaerota archaeon]